MVPLLPRLRPQQPVLEVGRHARGPQLDAPVLGPGAGHAAAVGVQPDRVEQHDVAALGRAGQVGEDGRVLAQASAGPRPPPRRPPGAGGAAPGCPGSPSPRPRGAPRRPPRSAAAGRARSCRLRTTGRDDGHELGLVDGLAGDAGHEASRGTPAPPRRRSAAAPCRAAPRPLRKPGRLARRCSWRATSSSRRSTSSAGISMSSVCCQVPVERTERFMRRVSLCDVMERSGRGFCERGDSNPHEFPHRILNPARLPVPPLSHGDREEPKAPGSGRPPGPVRWAGSRCSLEVLARIGNAPPGAARGAAQKPTVRPATTRSSYEAGCSARDSERRSTARSSRSGSSRQPSPSA